MPSHLSIRNKVAHRLANACLRLATPWYRDMIGGAIQYGLNAAARDHDEQRPAPSPWMSRVDVTGNYTRERQR